MGQELVQPTMGVAHCIDKDLTSPATHAARRSIVRLINGVNDLTLAMRGTRRPRNRQNAVALFVEGRVAKDDFDP